MNRLSGNRTYIKARAVFGVFFIGFGALIVFQIVHGVGFRVESIPGVLLGSAMIVLGYVRIRAAFSMGKPQP